MLVSMVMVMLVIVVAVRVGGADRRRNAQREDVPMCARVRMRMHPSSVTMLDRAQAEAS